MQEAVLEEVTVQIVQMASGEVKATIARRVRRTTLVTNDRVLDATATEY